MWTFECLGPLGFSVKSDKLSLLSEEDTAVCVCVCVCVVCVCVRLISLHAFNDSNCVQTQDSCIAAQLVNNLYFQRKVLSDYHPTHHNVTSNDAEQIQLSFRQNQANIWPHNAYFSAEMEWKIYFFKYVLRMLCLFDGCSIR